MAKVVLNPELLPERPVPMAPVKPPVKTFPYKDLGHPEEADAFRLLIRRLRHQSPAKRRAGQ